MTEILVATSIAAFVLTTTTTVLHRVMHQQENQRRAVGCQVSVTRLAITFRDDVHRAHACWSAPNDGAQERLVLEGPDHMRVEYTIGRTGIQGHGVHGHGVNRRVSRLDQILHRDQFPVGRDCAIEWLVEQSPNRAALIVRHQHIPQSPVAAEESVVSVEGSQQQQQPVRIEAPFRIEAIVGRDHRFMQTQERVDDAH